MNNTVFMCYKRMVYPLCKVLRKNTIKTKSSAGSLSRERQIHMSERISDLGLLWQKLQTLKITGYTFAATTTTQNLGL